MTASQRLSPKSVAVLSLIADGHSYSQIVDAHPDIGYLDIFAVAEEALSLNETQADNKERLRKIKLRKIKLQYPRAYEKWSEKEDAQLMALKKRGRSIPELAAEFQRQPSAIQSRLDKLILSHERGSGTSR